MKTVIGVRLSVEGFHNYPSAEENHGEVVKFLEFPHRHNFGIVAKRKVNHDDRDVEFILFKRAILTHLYKKYGSNENEDFPVCKFGTRSCEAIARELVEEFGLESCEVNEDGENFAEVTSTKEVEKEKVESSETRQTFDYDKAISFNKAIHWIVGRICSGKGTFAKKCPRDSNNVVIEVGALVRKITNINVRTYKKDLDEKLVELIVDEIITTKAKKIFIVGCRQLSVYKGVQKRLLNLNWNGRTETTILSATKEKRRVRWDQRLDPKDALSTFDKIEKDEEELGINDFISYLMDYEEVNIITN